jgi:hypothetical protein
MPQTSYVQELTKALAGMQAEGWIQPNRVISKTVVAANTAGIPFGIFVCRRTADDTCDLPAASGDVTTTGFGVSLLETARQPHSATAMVDDGTGGFVALEQLNILEQGAVWVLTEAAVNYGDAAFVRITASGGNTQLGKFGKVTDSGTAIALPGAKFIDTIGAAGLARVLLSGSGAAGSVGATGATGATGTP